jgi:hypothetical protein
MSHRGIAAEPRGDFLERLRRRRRAIARGSTPRPPSSTAPPTSRFAKPSRWPPSPAGELRSPRHTRTLRPYGPSLEGRDGSKTQSARRGGRKLPETCPPTLPSGASRSPTLPQNCLCPRRA